MSYHMGINMGHDRSVAVDSKFPLPPEKMVGWFSKIGIPSPELVSSLVAIGEVAAGIGIITGGLFATALGHLITRLSGALGSRTG